MFLRLINTLGRGLWRCGYRPELSVATILRSAERAVKLSDFGDEDFIEPLGDLISSYESESDLNPLGRMIVRQLLKTHAINRLLLQRAWRKHPECLEVEPARPLYVLGLPRTGTTLLYNLLCQDPQARPLLYWQTMFPAPFPSEWPDDGSRYRRRKARDLVRGMNWAAPRLRHVHEIRHDGPEECGWLHNNTFISQMFSLYGRIPSFVDKYWLQSSEHWFRVYDYYKRTLQLLQQGRLEKHWILKSPVHLGTIEMLFAAIPHARVVCTHRDPKEVIPSCCSLFNVTRKVFSDTVEKPPVGMEMLTLLADAADKADAVKARYSDRIFDAAYGNLVQDPIYLVRRIYDSFDIPFSSEFEGAMRDYLARNPKHKHGVHRYTLEEYGLTPRMVDERFKDYIERLERLGHQTR